MTAENASVLAIREKLARAYAEGEAEGYAASPNALPDFFYKPYINWTAHQRGYIFGKGLARYEWERDNPVP